jgi:hypothetical protein
MGIQKSGILIFSCLVFLGCGSEETKQEEAVTENKPEKEVLVYPYKAKTSLNWVPGDEKNAVLVLESFKKYHDGDVKGTFAYFADSVEFISDRFYYKGNKDKLEGLITKVRANDATLSFEPDGWSTLYYPDQDDTWVTVWGMQRWTDKKGIADSAYIKNDFVVKKGKITKVDEKWRQFEPIKRKK